MLSSGGCALPWSNSVLDTSAASALHGQCGRKGVWLAAAEEDGPGAVNRSVGEVIQSRLGYLPRRGQRLTTRPTGARVDPRCGVSSMRLYTPGQMRGLFERRSLRVERLHKSVRFDEYGPEFARIIIVGDRPARFELSPSAA